jgi:hypothetical protein
MKKISLTDELYLRVPKAEIALVSDFGGEIQSTKLG